MFGSNFFQESLEGMQPGFMPSDFSQYMFPNFDIFPSDSVPRDFPSMPLFSDLDGMDHKNFMQMFDEGMKNMPEEMKNWLQMPFEFMLPPTSDMKLPSPPLLTQQAPNFRGFSKKIGTLTIEERNIKVRKFLEKRKLRNYKKKISYMCRKKVADNRIRIKGRFVSKTQAEALVSDKTSGEVNL